MIFPRFDLTSPAIKNAPVKIAQSKMQKIVTYMKTLDRRERRGEQRLLERAMTGYKEVVCDAGGAGHRGLRLTGTWELRSHRVRRGAFGLQHARAWRHRFV